MKLSEHPCFSEAAHARFGRLHIPCAPRCNFDCAFCGRGMDDGATRLPGRAMQIVCPDEAVDYVRKRLACHPEVRVLGVAGPGEPLYNPETFEVLALLKQSFPDLGLCLGTNGFLLPENAARLRSLGVETLTVTVNALKPETGAQLNDHILDERGNRLTGIEAAQESIARQLRGIELSAREGMTVKVNTVLVPGLNDGELHGIACAVHERGAAIMNVMPLKPAGRLFGWPSPSAEALRSVRDELSTILPQFRRCAQCRADACGLIGEGEAGGCVK